MSPFFKTGLRRFFARAALTASVFTGFASTAHAQGLSTLSLPSPAEVSRVLNRPIANFAEREATAPPQIKARLERLRAQIKDKSFTVGYTAASDLPLEVLAGTRIPRTLPGVAERVNALASRLRLIDIESAAASNQNIAAAGTSLCSPTAQSFDWRKSRKVTAVKTQVCGTCWNFTAMAAYEGSYAIRNNQLIDPSEQYILNCSGAGGCSGGWWMPVFDYMISHGTATEVDVPFTGNDQQMCPVGKATPYRASAWGFVATDISTIPQVSAVKEALCQHGPLATAVFVDQAFQDYTGGVFPNQAQYQWINHGVTIIGWDDSKRAWLIKNSWGTNWGENGGFGNERGYMWIAYDANKVGIATAWVDAMALTYKLSPGWGTTLMELKVQIQPLIE